MTSNENPRVIQLTLTKEHAATLRLVIKFAELMSTEPSKATKWFHNDCAKLLEMVMLNKDARNTVLEQLDRLGDAAWGPKMGTKVLVVKSHEDAIRVIEGIVSGTLCLTEGHCECPNNMCCICGKLKNPLED